jgi:hypothetical protein
MAMSNTSSDVDFLSARYAAARNKYKPAAINTLLIGEAPPCDFDRYFYFEAVPKQDSLFLETMGVLYPEMKAAYLASKRDPVLKAELLEHFQSDGYWLIDLSEVPHELTGGNPEDALPGLLERVKKIADKKTNIIVIKSNVYDCCYPALKELGYKVSSERIPFPGSGQQGVFRERFKRALKMS